MGIGIKKLGNGLKLKMQKDNMYNFKTEPFEHQKIAYHMLRDLDYFAVTADMGTGKTKIVIDIAGYKFLETKTINAMMVIAPNGVHTQWVEEQLPIHCNVPYTAIVWNSAKRTNQKYSRELKSFLTSQTDKLKVFAVNVEAFQSDSIMPIVGEFVKNHNVFSVVDESTRIKNPKAKRSGIIHRLNKYGTRCTLTGTPVAKSPFDLWSQYEFLKANYFDCNYFIFQHRYGVMMQGVNPMGGRYRTLLDEKMFNIVKHKIKGMREARNGKLMEDDYATIASILGLSERDIRFIEDQEQFVRYRNLDNLKQIVSPITFSIRKEDCFDLPPKVHQKVIIDMPREQRRIYDDLKKNLLAQYSEEKLTVTNKLSLSIRFMQICGGFFPFSEEIEGLNGSITEVKRYKPIGVTNEKMRLLSEDIEDTDEPVIVWAVFIPEILALHKQLTKVGRKVGLYYGAVSQEGREQVKKQFNDGTIDTFLGNGQTAAYGLNLQISTMQMFFSNNYRTEDRLQMEDRSHRYGMKGTCRYRDYLYKNTIDEKIYLNFQEGKKMNDFFTRPLKEIL